MTSTKNSEEVLDLLIEWLDSGMSYTGNIVADPEWLEWPNAAEEFKAFSAEYPDIELWVERLDVQDENSHIVKYKNGQETKRPMQLDKAEAVTMIENTEMQTFDLSDDLAEAGKLFALLLQDWQKSNSDDEFLDWIAERIRFDTGTKMPMISGFCFGNGDAYFSKQEDAEVYCQNTYGMSVSELYSDASDEVYHTDWYQ